jgi:hypothetical protein
LERGARIVSRKSVVKLALILALSPKERENRFQVGYNSWRRIFVYELARILPLLGGEGRGEGDLAANAADIRLEFPFLNSTARCH